MKIVLDNKTVFLFPTRLVINRFFRGDYVIYGMIKSAISLTVAFALAVGMWIIYHAEELMHFLHQRYL